MFNLLLPYLLLCLSAFAAGVVNSIAGGGTLLTFPMLLHAGVSSQVANETSTVALVPGSMAGVWGFRRDLEGARSWLLLLVGPSLGGGLAGALLLTRLDPKYFELVVPWLLLLAAVLFAGQPYLKRLLQPPETERPAPLWLRALLVVFQFFIGVYGGYFGAGIGILMLASLGLMGVGSLNRMNAVKNVLACCINGISVVVFVAENQVVYQFALPMMAAAITGGYCGSSVGRLLPRWLVRGVVIVVGLGLAAYYFAKHAGLFGPADGA